MSYFETRPALVDIDNDSQLMARVLVRDGFNDEVVLTMTGKAGQIDLSIHPGQWRKFAQAIAREVASWSQLTNSKGAPDDND